MNAAELFQAAIRLLAQEGLLDIAVVVTRRDSKLSDVLWWSTGVLRKELKRKLHAGGIPEAFLKVTNNGDGRWKATVVVLEGVDEKHGQVLLWNFGRKHKRWEQQLH